MSNIYGRQVVLPLTNKSGGGVIAGDVVIIDTSNDTAFTTTTSAGFTGGVGVAQETIANNAVGRVLIAGYAALVNTSASVTRGQYGTTHTVAKQAVGTASRGAGTFAQWLTGGTTPTARIFSPDLAAAAGNVAADAIWDAAGDLAVGSGADTAAKLSIGATNGMALQRVSGAVAWALPSGYEYDYVAFTSPVSITATSEATANTVVTGSAVTYDGSTVVMVEFFCPYGLTPPADAAQLNTWLYDGSSSIGRLEYRQNDGNHNAGGDTPSASAVFGSRRLTPSNASHTYSVRSSVSTGTGSMGAGAGGNAAVMPGFIRITKV